jgi:hypothetical protein
MSRKLILLTLCFLLYLLPGQVWAQETTLPKQTKTVYVPVYSHIYGGAKNNEIQLTASVFIRNTDPEKTLTVKEVHYYNFQGTLLKKYISQPKTIPPLGTVKFIVDEADRSGGSGACFIIKWQAEKKISSPLVEAIMITTRMQLGISFTSRGVIIDKD